MSPTTSHAPEQVRVERGARTDQTIIIGVDSTTLGPALGGCRITTYPTWRDGLTDALRLSAAMTEKAALAGLAHGGGKTVVALAESTAAHWTGPLRADLLADVGDLIERLDGRYVTGPDIGSGPDDMAVIGRRTRHVLCRPESAGGSGDSSGPTAAGVTSCLRVVCEHVWPGRDLASLRFAVLGLGHVGTLVGAHLAAAGARLAVTDIDPARRALADRWGATWIDPHDALGADVDVLVPAAVGAVLTPAAVARLRCRAVVGPANNQLDDDATADLLHARAICWAPDTVVSAGGIVASVARELPRASPAEAARRVPAIGRRLRDIRPAAAAAGVPPQREARARTERLTGEPR